MNAYTRDELKAKLATLRARKKSIEAEIQKVARLVEASTPKPKSTRRPRNQVPDCGTESGYQRHRYLGEERCADCKKAHAAYTAEKATERRERLARIVDAA